MKTSRSKIFALCVATLSSFYFLYLVFLPWKTAEGRSSINIGQMIARVMAVPYEIFQEHIGIKYPYIWNVYAGIFTFCVAIYVTCIVSAQLVEKIIRRT